MLELGVLVESGVPLSSTSSNVALGDADPVLEGDADDEPVGDPVSDGGGNDARKEAETEGEPVLLGDDVAEGDPVAVAVWDVVAHSGTAALGGEELPTGLHIQSPDTGSHAPENTKEEVGFAHERRAESGAA